MIHRVLQLMLSFVISFLLTQEVKAQNYSLQINQIGLEDGLSSYTIQSIVQDQRGFIWLATDYGLNRYDGHSFQTYTKEENGLCTNNIYHLREDSKGMLWLLGGDFNGKVCTSIFNPLTEEIYTIEDYLEIDLPFDPLNSFYEVTLTETFILFTVQATEREAFRVFEYDVQQKTIDSIFEENDFRLNNRYPNFIYKIASNEYLFFIEKKKGSEFQLLYANRAGIITDSLSLSSSYTNGRIIEETRFETMVSYTNRDSKYADELLFINSQKERIGPFETQKHAHQISSCKNEKVYLLDTDSLRVFNRSGKLLRAAAIPFDLNYSNNTFYVDKDENCWVVNDEHLYCLSLVEQFFQKEMHDRLPTFKSRGIAKDRYGSLHVGAIGTLWSKIDGLWRQTNPYLENYLHNSLGFLIDQDSLWVGLQLGNVLRYQIPSMTVQKMEYQIKEQEDRPWMVWSIFKTRSNKMWIGTATGLFYWSEAKQNMVSFDTGGEALGKMSIWAFYENKAGVWLSTSKGLFLVDLDHQKILKHYAATEKGSAYIPATAIVHLHEDDAGVFWLATKGDGLIQWNPKTKAYKQYTQKGAGLSHNVLYGVYGDDFGNLWMPSQRGLMRFNKATAHVQIYLKADGLPHNEFNTISHYQAADGRLFFGGQNGFIHFHPNTIEKNNLESSFIITGAFKEKNGKELLVNETSKLLLNHEIEFTTEDKSFFLQVALLDYRDSKNHQYSYQIEGYDTRWNYLSNHEVKINNLPYGNYELKLRAKPAHSSEWQVYPKTIQIHVLKPFYWQTWFILLEVLMGALVIGGLFKWRISQLKRREKALEAIVKERTAKIEADKQLIEAQAAELKALDKVKSRFFANISHELRTPLTLILGPLSYILDEPEAWEEAKVKKQLLTMQRNGKSLMDLIEEILDLSKLEANKLELQEETTPVKQFFERIFAVFESQFQSLGIQHQLNFDLATPKLNVQLDRKKLEKVVNNYLSNAIKFTHQGGRVTLLVKELETAIHFEVNDTGMGVHPNDLPYIFERFYQSKQAEQKLFGGTGIGLALVNEFAALMTGKAYAESELGKGSTFYFEFPKKVVAIEKIIASQQLVESETEEIIDHIGTDFTILVVEDNPDMREFVRELLQARYKKVLTADNGLEGLKLLESLGTKIDLIVSDVMMPEMDGLTMLKEIKSNAAWNNIPVVMLTALAAERDKLTALTIGVDDYLTKPFSVTELLVRVQNLLYNSHQRKTWQKAQVDENFEEDLSQDEKEQNLPQKEDLIEQSQENQSVVDKRWIDEIILKVKASLETQPLNVEGLAEVLFISKRQLTRKIKAITGLTPAKFIREVQLQEARKAFENGNFISIAEVCYNNGFENPNSFSTLFKKRFGKSPREYVKDID